MKLKLSKLHLALLAAGFGSAVCGTTYALTADSFPVVVPVNKASFYGAVTGIWATPTNDDLYYAMTGTRDSDGNRAFHNIDLDNEWGWRLDAGYLFPCTGNDVSVNWTYFCGDDNGSANDQRDSFPRYIPGSSWNSASGDVEFDFNEVNLELGQKVDFCSLHTRFHFGLSYVSLDHDFDTKAAGGNSYRRLIGNAHQESEFEGIGPRFGMDVAYPLGSPCSPVSVVGHLSGSVLAGEICVKESGHVITVNSESTSVDTFRTRSDDICTVIPAGMMKLGLRYASNSDSGCGGYAAEVGYKASGYFHVVNHSQDFDRSHRTGIINPISNFGIYGWYLTLSYAG